MAWHARVGALIAALALSPAAFAQLDSMTPYPPVEPGMTGNLEFDTALPGGVTPLMTMDEIAGQLNALGYAGYSNLMSINFQISTGLSGPTPFPSGDTVHVGAYSVHRINVWHDHRDFQKVSHIDAQMFFDFDCFDRLKVDLGEASICRGELGVNNYGCEWNELEAGYRVVASLGHYDHICKIRMEAPR